MQAVRAGVEAYFAKPSMPPHRQARFSYLRIYGYCILVIDGDAELSAYYSLMLTQAGMITDLANEMVKVISDISEFNPDLILVEICM